MFLYRLAVKLGYANVDALARSLTAKQFMEWERYARLEPFDETRQDYRTASIVQMIANVNRGSKQKAYALQDFLLRFDPSEEKPTPRKQPWEEQLMWANIIARAQNAGAKGTS